jgi:hypothetical protein
MIEPGWTVVGRDGSDIGRVAGVVGDPVAGIFNGLAIDVGMLAPTRYLPAEQVGDIVEGRISVDLDAAGAEALERHEAPPSVDIRPD